MFQGGLLLPIVLLAQSVPSSNRGELTVAKIVPRECRGGADEEITVCGRRDRGESRYRLPIRPDRFDPAGPVDSVSRERHRLYEHGDTGIHSCSPVGPGGWTGCTFKQWKDAREQYGK